MYTALPDRSLRQASKRETTVHADTIERFLSVSVKFTFSEVIKYSQDRRQCERYNAAGRLQLNLVVTTPCRLKHSAREFSYQLIWSQGYPLTFRLLMSYIYIYGAHILDVSRSHTTTHHSW